MKYETDLTVEEYLDKYSVKDNLNYKLHKARYDLIKERSSIKGMKILDLGCGEGFGSNVLAKENAEVIGCDLHEGVIERANKKYASDQNNLLFEVGDAYALKYKNDSFDIICAYDLIEHLDNPIQMLKEVKRILKKDGVFYCATPNRLRRALDGTPIYPFHVKEYLYSEFYNELSQVFSSIKIIGQNPEMVNHFLDKKWKFNKESLFEKVRRKVFNSRKELPTSLVNEILSFSEEDVDLSFDFIAICKKIN